jgi:hypothetical protein
MVGKIDFDKLGIFFFLCSNIVKTGRQQIKFKKKKNKVYKKQQISTFLRVILFFLLNFSFFLKLFGL